VENLPKPLALTHFEKKEVRSPYQATQKTFREFRGAPQNETPNLSHFHPLHPY
jgi:hypothetical protein